MFKSCIKYYAFFAACLASIVSAPVQSLTVTNIDIYHNTLKSITLSVPQTQPIEGEPATMGSCWGNNTGPYTNFEEVKFGDSLSTAKTAENEYICVQANYSTQKFATNPLKNSADCEIQFFKTEGGNDNPGTARASKACGYVGRCVDGKPYNDNNRDTQGENGEGSDSFKKNCLPYSIKY